MPLENEEKRKYRHRHLFCKFPATFEPPLHNRLQLPRIPNRILNHLSTRHQNLLFRASIEPLLRREIDPSVLDPPSSLLGEFDDAAFAVEKEEVFRVGDGEGRIGLFGAGGDFGSDGVDEDLFLV